MAVDRGATTTFAHRRCPALWCARALPHDPRPGFWPMAAEGVEDPLAKDGEPPLASVGKKERVDSPGEILRDEEVIVAIGKEPDRPFARAVERLSAWPEAVRHAVLNPREDPLVRLGAQ